MAELVTLRVNGKEWSTWESVTLNDYFGEALCSRFEATLSDSYRGDFAKAPIRRGDKYQLLLGGELRQTGYINKPSTGYGPNRHGIKLSGRDLTQDLVDCSSTRAPGSWSNRKLESIASDICAEFNIQVVAGDDTGNPISQAALQVGDTPHQFLEKLCRSRNVWMVSTAAGQLTFAKASTVKLDNALVRGVNIEEADADLSDENRFSVYIGKGQQRGSDQLTPTAAAVVTGQVTDPAIKRHRPMIVQGEDQQDGETLGDRLLNERNKRIGDSESAKIKVAGWRMKSGAQAGQVWPTNRLVPLVDDWLGLNVVYAIEQVQFTIAKEDNSAQLTLVPPAKFDIHASATATKGLPSYSAIPDPSDPFPGVP